MSQTNINSPATTTDGFNARTLWPDMIRTPTNKWVYTCKEIVDRLGTDPHIANELKRRMEKCLMYFYVMKKQLKLFDHTYTAACILFFRYWFVYGLPPTLTECIHLSQAMLVTACKTVENNRPIDVYVKGTSDFMLKDVPTSRGRQNVEKLRWELRDRLVACEKQVLCQLGFDLNLNNPKELIEEIFSGYFRYNRDFELSEEFTKALPKIIQDARNFIIQAGTQPVSLLCDGFTFTALSLVFCGLQFKKNMDSSFRFPKNFFSQRFPFKATPLQFVELLTDYRVLEDNFFDLKSNKGDKLQVSLEEMNNLIDEDEQSEESMEKDHNVFVYENIKDGIVREELLKSIEGRIEELTAKIKTQSEASEKRAAADTEIASSAAKKRKQ
ncbi:LANO_0E11364g1_1 [Lachancea nothofagi CBS 11611]|uniref:LANO_0E11364g1_1 n=1 Tax=Lachancea nothofagi CBS 11611 TaxID=1266666 RepID=A0A1G4JXE3_9SACH|nr:LANO_0E11364g1_1 [Lachancea nothofagi CBS 11611]